MDDENLLNVFARVSKIPSWRANQYALWTKGTGAGKSCVFEIEEIRREMLRKNELTINMRIQGKFYSRSRHFWSRSRDT